MTASRKPKKVLIQFAVALIVAVALGIGAIFIGFTLISSISGRAEQSRKQAQQRADQLQVELERIKSAQGSNPANPQSYKVVSAQVDIQPGQAITPDMLTLSDISEQPRPGTLNLIADAVGKMVHSPVMRGENLRADQLIDASSLSIPPGQRAMTIRVDGMASVNGAVSPGERVDVLSSIVRQDKALTRTLLQNIPVIAVSGGATGSTAGGATITSGMTTGSSGGAGEFVTLLVTPKQAETLTLAGQVGVFHLTLRNMRDTQISRSFGTDLNALLTGAGGSEESSRQTTGAIPRPPNFGTDAGLPPPPMPGGKSGFSMRIYRGSGSETIEFQQ